jgi:hypothetical protein
MAETRDNILRIFAGNLGTGKTSGCFAYANKFLTYHPLNKILVVDNAKHPFYNDFDNVSINGIHKSKSRYIRCEEANEDELFYYIQHHVSNTFVIFEDAAKYMSANITNAQKNCIVDMRKNNKEFAFMFHYLSEVPLRLTKYYEELILYKTHDDFSSKQGKWANWHIIKEKGLQLQKSKNKHEHTVIKM